MSSGGRGKSDDFNDDDETWGTWKPVPSELPSSSKGPGKGKDGKGSKDGKDSTGTGSGSNDKGNGKGKDKDGDGDGGDGRGRDGPYGVDKGIGKASGKNKGKGKGHPSYPDPYALHPATYDGVHYFRWCGWCGLPTYIRKGMCLACSPPPM